MADVTTIEWTDATWNPIGGCSIASPGCAPCYAQRLAGTRLRHHPLYAGTTTPVKGKPVFNGHLTAAPDDHPVWTWPLRWRGAKHPKLGAGKPSLIFVGDMSDLFHGNRPRDQIDRTVSAIVSSRHIGQLLTKRPQFMLAYFAELAATDRWVLFDHPLTGQPNFDPVAATFEKVFLPQLWLGTSAERQREFDQRWPYLRELAGMGFTVFVSYEPAIGPLVLPDDFLKLGRRAQLIAGGMSGRDTGQPLHPAWVRAVRDQCAGAGVPFFFKQWGEWAPWHPASDRMLLPNGFTRGGGCSLEQWPDGAVPIANVGKRAAGRTLDGVEHNGFPGVPA